MRRALPSGRINFPTGITRRIYDSAFEATEEKSAMAQLHGKDGLFTSDPTSFIEKNPCTLGGWGGSDTDFAGTYQRSAVGKNTVEYLVTPGSRMEAHIYVEDQYPALSFAPRIRLLPSTSGT